jgi:hypothetical protein
MRRESIAFGLLMGLASLIGEISCAAEIADNNPLRDYEYPENVVFGSGTEGVYHDWPEWSGGSRAGLFIGFIVLGVFWIFVVVNLLLDEIKRHKDYS